MTIDLASKPLGIGDFVVFADTNSMLNVGMIIYISTGGKTLKVVYISATKRKLPSGQYKFKTVLAEQYASCDDVMRIPEMIATTRILKRPYWIAPNPLNGNVGPDSENILTEGLELMYKLKTEIHNKIVEENNKLK
jgi:hypothetical protein